MLTNIENTLHFSEEQLLQTEVRHSVELQHLDDLVERATSRSYTQGLGVSKTVAVLQNREVDRSPSPRVWILGIVVVLAGLGILWIIWVKSPGVNYPCIRQPNRAHVEGKELNKSNLGLQVELKEIGDNSRGTPGETVMSASLCILYYCI